MFRIALLILPALLALAGETLVPQNRSDLELTLYNDDRVFVHDLRELNVSSGRQTLVYEGVASSLLSASVIPTFLGPPVRLYSQNYRYDLISLPSMLRHSVGREVSFFTNGKQPVRSEGTLLAYQPTVMVREKGSGRILSLEKPTQVLFREIPPGMAPRPSLVWNVDVRQSGNLKVDLKYLATGISWKSDYVLDLRDDTLDLTGWITIDNRSGVSYSDARIACLAGEVHKVRTPAPIRRMVKAMPAAAAPEVRQEAFAGYHLYRIPFRETLADKERKQIPFLRRSGIACRRYGKTEIRSFPRSGVEKLRFVQTLEFSNRLSNGLGTPLPAGIARVYSRDAEGTSRFIGESRIGNIPADENVTLPLGILFDVVGEKRVTRYVSRTGYRSATLRYSLRNRGKTPQILKIEERIPTYGDRIELRSDCSGPCSVRTLSAFVREFTVRLEGGKSYEFTSGFEVWK